MTPGTLRPAFRWNPIDWFFALNVCLFLLLCACRYYHRFIAYRGIDNIHEFFIYAVVLISAVALIWHYFRHLHFPPYLLALVELGILIHFFGAFIRVDGGRLYDVVFMGIRYDKFVHFTNALVVCIFLRHLFVTCSFPRSRLALLFIGLSTMGLGALIEILEYIVVKTVPHNGVGDYDNNLQDLCANLAGCLVFAVARLLARRAGRPE
jgi:hypothetical protein